MSSETRFDLEVAVVGMAGRFPGAASVEPFWRNLCAGVESIRDLSDDELRAAGVDEATLADPRLVRRAADLEGADRFDAGLFGFTPREAELMDPQLRVFLEDAWAALEDAGHLSDRRDRRVGVFAGAGAGTYLLNNVLTNPRAAEAVGAFQTSIGNERDYLATHVSYRLDLRGPSLAVQTACSTSLVAVHLACQSLLARECDVALAGGVSISVPQTAGYLFEEGGIGSPDGRCRAFDADAAGCVKGNGSVVVVLRRLEDALRDGDAIRAVIKGSAVNNDGALKVGFTAPSVEGQAEVVAEALAAAGVAPETIGFVEAHGTATALGDPVEVEALARAFGEAGALRPGTCALGSLKTNVGHLDAAAGAAGLIKAVLALERETIPPTLHFRRPNPRLDLAATPFFVNAAARGWPRSGAPRRAGVSSFGIGGTNAHVILEEAPATARRARAREAQVIVLSAATQSTLAAASADLAARIELDGSLDLADAAFTLQVGRRRLPWRRAVVARDAAGALAALRGGGRDPAPRRDERRDAEVAFLFPGQGAQHAGMARDLHAGEPAFRQAVGRCAEILRPVLDIDLREAVFAGEDDQQASEERLRSTGLAQPALFTVEYALARLWISWGIRPAVMAGHSVGEYVAACLAGVLSLEDAALLVAERGRLMESLPRGAMLAVPLGEDDLAARLRGRAGVSLAAVNAPASCVASGPESEIERLEAELGAAGIVSRRLRTSHAFHSPMMEPILEVFERRVRAARLAPPSIPFVSNVTGTWITPEQATDPAYWAGHLRRTVRFADGIATIAADPSRILLEVGPGLTLCSLARQQAGPETVIVSSLRRPKDGGEDATAMLEALARLWCSGADVDWEAFHDGFGRRRVSLPTYPFERRRHWIEPGAAEGRRPEEAPPAKEPDLARWFHVPGWRRLSPPRAHAGGGAGASWLVLDDSSELSRALVARAASGGARVSVARPGPGFDREADGVFVIDPRRREDYLALLRDLRAQGRLPRHVAHLWCAGSGPIEPDAAQDLGFFSLVFLLQAFGEVDGGGEVKLAAVANGLFDVAGESTCGPERATLIGACRVAPQEYPWVSARLIDLGVAPAAAAAGRILGELDSIDREPVVAWRGGHRWTPSYERLSLEAPPADPDPIRPGGVYVLTGGTGPLEIGVARRLASSGAAGIVFLECDGTEDPALESLRAAGVTIVLSPARVTGSPGASAALEQARARLGRIDAVFHTAGSIGGGMIQLKDREAARAVIAPRLEGARALAEAMHDGETLVLFSSAVSATGVFGQSDFCAASAFLGAFAQSRRRGAGPRVLAIDWGTAHWDRWEAAAAPGQEALAEQLREIQRTVGITVEEGVEALWRALALGEPQVVVSPQDLETLVAQSTSASVREFLEGAGRTAAAAADREGRAIVPLETDTERRVAAAWTDLLGVASIGRDDSFFDLGGNSLLAIQLAAHLRKGFDVDLSIATLFESADLASLAAAVDAALAGRRRAEEVARLLEEIEGMTEDQVREELQRDAGEPAAEHAA